MGCLLECQALHQLRGTVCILSFTVIPLCTEHEPGFFNRRILFGQTFPTLQKPGVGEEKYGVSRTTARMFLRENLKILVKSSPPPHGPPSAHTASLRVTAVRQAPATPALPASRRSIERTPSNESLACGTPVSPSAMRFDLALEFPKVCRPGVRTALPTKFGGSR